MPYAELFPILSERLILRRFELHDLAAFVRYRSDPNVARYQSWESISDAEAQLFLEEQQNIAFGILGAWLQIAITTKEQNKLIGDIGIIIKSQNPTTAEIGFTLSAEHQGKGYAFEGVAQYISTLFAKTSIRCIEGITDNRNLSSIRLLIKLGMKKVKEEQAIFKGESCVESTYLICKEN